MRSPLMIRSKQYASAYCHRVVLFLCVVSACVWPFATLILVCCGLFALDCYGRTDDGSP